MVNRDQAYAIIQGTDNRGLRQLLIMIRDGKPISSDEKLNAEMCEYVEKLAIARGIARPVVHA